MDFDRSLGTHNARVIHSLQQGFALLLDTDIICTWSLVCNEAWASDPRYLKAYMYLRVGLLALSIDHLYVYGAL
jgi:hypothetical protein